MGRAPARTARVARAQRGEVAGVGGPARGPGRLELGLGRAHRRAPIGEACERIRRERERHRLPHVGAARGYRVGGAHQPRECGGGRGPVVLGGQQGELGVPHLDDRAQRVGLGGGLLPEPGDRVPQLPLRLLELGARRRFRLARGQHVEVLLLHLELDLEALGHGVGARGRLAGARPLEVEQPAAPGEEIHAGAHASARGPRVPGEDDDLAVLDPRVGSRRVLACRASAEGDPRHERGIGRAHLGTARAGLSRHLDHRRRVVEREVDRLAERERAGGGVRTEGRGVERGREQPEGGNVHTGFRWLTVPSAHGGAPGAACAALGRAGAGRA